MSPDTIFAEAIEIASAPERAAFLDEACGNDPQLRREVDQLVRDHFRAGAFLERPAAHLVDTASEAVRERPGTVIGSYKLLEPIGEGGMGIVFRAEQQQPVRRQVALKVIKPGMDTRHVIARFEAERQALAVMDHPHIAKVLDAGETASGRPYFVMELVRGLPLTDYCDQAHLTPRERLELFVSVCQAVQHAHQKGIIHRDLKPSNVLVSVQDGQPAVKVIDFGIAKATGDRLTDKTLVTGFAQLVGTPLYMSPEQAGLSPDIDTRSDIYSLGVLLYELLTGTTPFAGARLREASYDEIRRIIREEEPPKPSTRISTLGQAAKTVSANRRSDPQKLGRFVRGELDWIVMKALDKDRNRRYESANGLARDVQRYLADEPVLACPPSAGYRLRKFARRHKGRLAVAAGVFLAVTATAASIGWAVRDRAARQAEVEQAETGRLARVEGQVRASLGTVRTLMDENKLAPAHEKLAQVRAQLGSDGSALGSLTAEVAAVGAELDRFQQLLDLVDRAHQAETAPFLEATLTADDSDNRAGTPARTRQGEWRPAAAVPFLREALGRYGVLERDDWSSVLEGGLLGRQQVEHVRRLAYEELLWLAEDVVRRRHEHGSERKLSAEAAARQALVYLGKAERAYRPTQAFHTLRARCHKTLGEEAAEQADTQRADQTPASMALDYALQGRVAYEAQQLAEAVQAFEAALRLEPTHYWSLMRLGYCLCDLGQGPEDFAGAARVFTGCILKRPDHAHAYYGRANAYSKLRRSAEAVADFSKAIELDPKHLQSWCNRGNAHARLGRRDRAVVDYSQALRLDPKQALVWNNRGVVYSELDQIDRAVADFSQALEVDPTYAPAWSNRGWAYSYKLGQPGRAVADLSKVIELTPNDASAWSRRGYTYDKLDRSDEAIADLSKAIDLDPKHVRAWNNRGIVYAKLDRSDEAIADLSKAIDLDPKYAPAWFNRGVVHGKLNRSDEAIADYSQAVELDPKQALTWFNRGVVYAKLSRLDQAVTDFSKAIELAPDDLQIVQAYLTRAQTHTRLGHFEQARADYETFLKHAPAHAGAYNALAKLLIGSPGQSLRDPNRPVELAKKAAQLEPRTAGHWKTLGIAHCCAKDWKAAVAAFDKFKELRANVDAVDRFFLAMAHAKLGNQEEARRAYEQALQWLEKNKKALEKDPGQAKALRHLRAETEEVLELKTK